MRLDLAELTALRDLGYLRVVPHPDGLDLHIANYTSAAQYDDLWGDHPVLLDCRGTIIRSDGTVVAKPLKKFFGVGQRPELSIERLATLGTPEVAHKLDGSMVTLYRTPDGEHCATRGSFTSPQAWAATRLWRACYAPALAMPLAESMTYVFEYCAPDNRIVVAYPAATLTLIGAIHTRTGLEYSYAGLAELAAYPGLPCVARETPADWAALLGERRPNFEGYVLYWPTAGLRVKVKLAEYLRLHRLITGLSERTVWEALRSFANLDAIRRELPEETRAWFDGRAEALVGEFGALSARVLAVVTTVREAGLDSGDRAQRRGVAEIVLAETVGAPAVRAACFLELDGKGYADVLWKALEPRGAAVTRWQSMDDEEEA